MKFDVFKGNYIADAFKTPRARPVLNGVIGIEQFKNTRPGCHCALKLNMNTAQFPYGVVHTEQRKQYASEKTQSHRFIGNIYMRVIKKRHKGHDAQKFHRRRVQE
jgi:hypothetical protein